MSSVVIRHRDDQPGAVEVLVDGYDIAHGLTGVDVRIRVGAPTEVTAHVLVWDADIQDTGAHVVITEPTAQVLRRLGWSPPTSAETATPDGDRADPS